MSYDTIMINILSAFLGSLYIIYFFRTVIEMKLSRPGKIRFIAVFSMINGAISSLMQTSVYKPLILLVLSIIIIRLLLKASFIQSFLSFALYIIGLAVGNALIPIMLSLVSPGRSVESVLNDPLMSLAGNLFTNIVVFILFALIKPTKDYIKMISRDKFLLILTAITIIVICSTFAMYLYTKTLNVYACLIIASISISYCVFILLMWFASLRRVIRDEDLKQQKFYNDSLRSTLFELRRFRHDWVNNLTVIDSMIKMNKNNDLKQYVSELIDQCSHHINTQIYDIKNAGLFGILSSKINLACEKGISVNMSVIGEIEDIPEVKISELCEIVGIFMDNAIEESENGDKIINLNIKDASSFMEISISNSCSSPPDMQKINIDGYSSKGVNRGMGLAIAKKIIEKYKNILHVTTYEDNTFTQTIEIANKKGV